MPIGQFTWLDDFTTFFYDWKYWTGSEEFGWILEVDLEYPSVSFLKEFD